MIIVYEKTQRKRNKENTHKGVTNTKLNLCYSSNTVLFEFKIESFNDLPSQISRETFLWMFSLFRIDFALISHQYFPHSGFSIAASSYFRVSFNILLFFVEFWRTSGESCLVWCKQNDGRYAKRCDEYVDLEKTCSRENRQWKRKTCC